MHYKLLAVKTLRSLIINGISIDLILAKNISKKEHGFFF